MKVLRFRANFFTTYFLSLVVIFLIPFSILGFTMYRNSVGNIKSQIETTSLNQLEQIKYMIDLRLEELNNLSVRIAYDPALTPFMLQNGGYAAKVAIEELGKYKANSAIVEDIYLYLRGDSMIYSQAGMQSLDVVADRVYRMTEASKEQLIDDLNHLSAPLLRGLSQANQRDMIAYYYPIRPNDSYFYGTIMYAIKDSVLLNFIGSTLKGNEGTVVIFDQSGDIFLKHGEPNRDHDSLSIQAFIQQTGNSGGTGIRDVEYEGERYSYIHVTSDASGLTFAAIVPSNQFLQPVTQMQRFLLTLMVVIVCLGVGTAALIALRNTKPIRELANFIKNFSNGDRMEKRSDLDQIKEIFTEVYDKQQELKLKMNVQKPWAFERVLTKLLHGSFHDLQQVRADLDAVGMSLEADHFFVMVVDNTEADIAGILPAAFRDPVAFAYASELLREDSLAILVGYFKKDSTHRQIQEQAAATLIDLLQERGQRNFFIGIGTVHSQLLHTNRSYIEAMGAIEYKFTQSDEVVIFFEDIRERNNLSFRVPFKEKVRFVESLRQADKQVALEALHSMFRSIERNEQSVISLKMDKRIGTIIREAGYVDASNFIRKFKQTVGMTPGQYRASHRLLQSGGISPVKAKSHP